MIRIRSLGETPKSIKELFSKMPVKSWLHPTILASEVYRNSEVETDTTIILHHESERKDIGKSSAGVWLCAALKEYGLINHSVWIQEDKK